LPVGGSDATTSMPRVIRRTVGNSRSGGGGGPLNTRIVTGRMHQPHPRRRPPHKTTSTRPVGAAVGTGGVGSNSHAYAYCSPVSCARCCLRRCAGLEPTSFRPLRFASLSYPPAASRTPPFYFRQAHAHFWPLRNTPTLNHLAHYL
jgi:hypothetical protein